MENKSLRLVSLTLILVLLFTHLMVYPVYGQDDLILPERRQEASQILNRLTPEEKIGQLFLVTMDGLDISETSQIYNLISNYHIGGIVLKRSNDNFPDQSLLDETYSLISGLQKLEWQSSEIILDNEGLSKRQEYIPLFIGISQSGDLYPTDQIISRLTALPSQMAIGATWNLDLAKESGWILGRELSSLGFNLVFSPSLDVIETPYGEGRGDLGVRTFGGDPYWAGEFGTALIRGLHEGSNNRLAVIAKNFPGRGSSDRLPDEEVATVRKSLEQLKLIELAPFLKVTDIDNADEQEVVDGLLLSHIRYQGFQGNIRATTRPVSFDQTAVDLIFGISPLSVWREWGGVLVSDDLGSQAVRKFFSPEGQSFDARQIARNAFLSGNDVLYMDQLVGSNDNNRYESYIKILDHFVQKYIEDKSFADRVDQSVLRILTLKLKIYSEFDINRVLPDPSAMDQIGRNNEMVFNIISQGASLISPKKEQLNETIPDAPRSNERILIFTDNLSAVQCSTCAPIDIVPVDSLERTIIRLYGPAGSGQIPVQNLSSYSFNDIQDYINNPYNRPDLESSLVRANWVIFIVHDQSPERTGAYALHNLLAEKPESIRDKKVIVFSLNAPYYYDATEISAFTAFYALYSKIPSSIEVAARILFKEIFPTGHSPVSIPGIAYNLISVTSPHPEQVIEIFVDIPNEIENGVGENEMESVEGEIGSGLSEFPLGEMLPVRTGKIIDNNGNAVPDGTVVRFTMNLQGDQLTIQQVETTTIDGIARAAFKLQSSGLHEIRAVSEPALNSQILILDITEETGTIISAVTPTPIPTASVTEQPVSEESLPPESFIEIQMNNNRIIEWLIVTFAAWISGIIVFYITNFNRKISQCLRIACGSVIGGLLIGYWLILGLPGSFPRFGFSGYLSLLFFVLLGNALTGYFCWLATKE